VLIIVNPRIHPRATSFVFPLRQPRLVLLAAVWAALLVLMAILGQPAFSPDRWYRMTTIEGAPIYTPYATEHDCLAAAPDGSPVDEPACIPGNAL
jgi:hypothetical protein